MNDAFCVTFGCFCMWSCFNELLHDLACLEEFLTNLMKNRTCFEVMFVLTISLYFAGWIW